MLDLDAVQKRLDAVKGIPDDHTTWWWLGTHDVPALVAELRAAREVNELAQKAIVAARSLIGDMPEHVREPCYCPPQAHPTASAFAAFEAAYDKAMGGS